MVGVSHAGGGAWKKVLFCLLCYSVLNLAGQNGSRCTLGVTSKEKSMEALFQPWSFELLNVFLSQAIYSVHEAQPYSLGIVVS